MSEVAPYEGENLLSCISEWPQSDIVSESDGPDLLGCGGEAVACRAASVWLSADCLRRLKVNREDDREDEDWSRDGEEARAGRGLARAHEMLMTPASSPSPPAVQGVVKTQWQLGMRAAKLNGCGALMSAWPTGKIFVRCLAQSH